MAGIHPCMPRSANNKGFCISILLVSTLEEARDKLNEALIKYKRSKGYTYKLQVHKTDSVDNIHRAGVELNVDYIVFLIDLRKRSCFNEVKISVEKLNSLYMHGRFCLVNCFSNTGLSFMNNQILLEMSQTVTNLGACMLHGEVCNPTMCLYLAERILTLVSAAVGLESGVPYVYQPIWRRLMEEPTQVSSSAEESVAESESSQ